MRLTSPLFALLVAITPSPAFAQVVQPPPVIERIEPTSGPPGTQVQIIGRFFRTEQTVRLGEQPVEVISRLPNRWTIRVPQGARTGHVAIDVPSVGTAIGPEFRVLAPAPPPTITDVQPRTSSPGAEVRIVGENFSPRITENAVTLQGVPVVVRTATPTELRVIVPQGATTGRFVVRVSGSGEATAPVDLAIGAGLTIASFSPTIAAPGTRVTITGTGFSPRAADDHVFVGNAVCRVVAASATSLTIEVAPGATTGPILVEVRGGGRAYSSTPLVVQAAPTITGFSPPAGTPGSQVRIQGTHFGTDVRVVQVTIGGVPATVRGLTPTEIVAEVPANAGDGEIAVTVNGVGPATSRSHFDVVAPPVIADFSPHSGPVGTEVTITGSGFSTILADDRVSLSGAPCPVLSASATQLRVRIPQAASGPLALEVEHAGSTRTAQPFVVTTPPVITRIEPDRGSAGTVFGVIGRNFGTNAALVEVSIGDRRCEIRSVTDTRIDAVVPAGATTAPVRVTVRLQGTVASPQPFTVLGDFSVTAIDPATTFPGQPITIRGTGLTASGMQIAFGGVTVPYSFVSANEIRTWVPVGARSGTVRVTAADGRSAEVAFAVAAAPSGLGITAVDAQCLRPGCAVVIRGHGFAPSPGRNRVTIGTGRVRVRRATPYTLELVLPPRTTGTMTIRVEVQGAGTVESQPITIGE